jgi:hypothetical protein
LAVLPNTPIVPSMGSNVGQDVTGPVARQEKKQTMIKYTHRCLGVSKRDEKVGGVGWSGETALANSGMLGFISSYSSNIEYRGV